MAFQIIGIWTVCSTACSGLQRSKHRISASPVLYDVNLSVNVGLSSQRASNAETISMLSQISNTIGSPSIRHRSDTSVSDRYLIDGDLTVFGIRDGVSMKYANDFPDKLKLLPWDCARYRRPLPIVDIHRTFDGNVSYAVVNIVSADGLTPCVARASPGTVIRSRPTAYLSTSLKLRTYLNLRTRVLKFKYANFALSPTTKT